jgi:hypothetical protein
MSARQTVRLLGFLGVSLLAATDGLGLEPSAPEPIEVELQPLFPKEGLVLEGWTIREWDDVSRQPHKPVVWEVKNGVLHGTGGLPDDEWIGTWLLSEREYEDFVLDFEFRLGGKNGNGGLALRAPLKGDPAFDGMELQLTDPRYQLSLFPDATPAQLTGGIYLAIAPKEQAYKPEEWNHLRVELRGPSLRAWLNERLIHDANLDEEHVAVKRHESDEPVLPVSKRPRRGHIGFQDLSGEAGKLRVRNARFAELK